MCRFHVVKVTVTQYFSVKSVSSLRIVPILSLVKSVFFIEDSPYSIVSKICFFIEDSPYSILEKLAGQQHAQVP